MQHFLLEFITGGGMSGQNLPSGLQREGEQMLQTLVNELINAGHNGIVVARDPRLFNEKVNIKQQVLHELTEQTLRPLLQAADICWLIAPETDAHLATLAELFEKYARVYTGCSSNSIRLTGSKLATIEILDKAGLLTVETRKLSDTVPETDSGWVLKPDDGVGGEGCLLINSQEELLNFKKQNLNDNYIIQPFVKGRNISMSLLVYEKDFRLLACNQQYIKHENGRFVLEEIAVNECSELFDQLHVIANTIVDNISGLAGHIGVDLIETEVGPVFLELNPRLTTSYAGLSASLGINVTDTILKTFCENKIPTLSISEAKPVRIKV